MKKTNEHVAMDEDDSGFLGHRRVLGDVTNAIGKRRFLSTPGGSVLENQYGHEKIGDGKLEDDEFGRRVCKGVENLVKEKENVTRVSLRSENLPVDDGKNVPLLKAKRLCRSMNSGNVGDDESSRGNVAADVAEAPLEIKELPRSLNCDLHLSRGDPVMSEIMEGDGSRESSISSACLPMQCDKARNGDFQDDSGKISTDIMRNAVVVDDMNEEPVMSAYEKSDKGKHVADHWQFSATNACNFQIVGSQESKTDGGESLNQASLDNLGSTACLRESSSLGSKVFGSEGSAKVHESCSGDGEFNPNECFELDKTCSCPFCLKGIS